MDRSPPPSARTALAAGRYEVERTLGRGGMGTVYLARDRNLDRPVALKVLEVMRADDDSLARLEREAKLLLAASHEALVPLLDARLDHRPPYLVFRYLPGGTLSDRIEARGKATRGEVVEVGRRIASALHALHGMGILHRDVKPSNILLDEHGKAWLTDLGLGRPEDHGGLTGTGRVVGTPAYLAPELLAADLYSPRSDLFGLGLTLIELAAGRRLHLPAFASERVAELLSGIEDPGLRGILSACVAVAPERRPTSGAELEARLAALEPDRTRAMPSPGADTQELPRQTPASVPPLRRAGPGRGFLARLGVETLLAAGLVGLGVVALGDASASRVPLTAGDREDGQVTAPGLPMVMRRDPEGRLRDHRVDPPRVLAEPRPGEPPLVLAVLPDGRRLAMARDPDRALVLRLEAGAGPATGHAFHAAPGAPEPRLEWFGQEGGRGRLRLLGSGGLDPDDLEVELGFEPGGPLIPLGTRPARPGP